MESMQHTISLKENLQPTMPPSKTYNLLTDRQTDRGRERERGGGRGGAGRMSFHIFHNENQLIDFKHLCLLGSRPLATTSLRSISKHATRNEEEEEEDEETLHLLVAYTVCR